MKTLKFRIWNGSCFVTIPDTYIKTSDGSLWDYDYDYGGTFSSHQKLWSADGKIQQYTGLKDTKGKEIYEGDILKHDIGFGPLYWEVIWDQEAGAWKTTKEYGGNTGSWFDCYEIAGNIFETPELLKT
jgi:uncharacterized phage protein (TIGR01671 family)